MTTPSAPPVATDNPPSSPSPTHPNQSSPHAPASPTTPVTTHSDGFAEFMQLGDATVPADQSIPTPAHHSATPSPPPSPPSPPPNPVAFFTGLLTRATTTIEATLNNAAHNIPQPATVISQTTATVSDFVTSQTRPQTRTPTTTETTQLKHLHPPTPPLHHARTQNSSILLASQTSIHLYTTPTTTTPLTAHYNLTWSPDRSHALSTPPPPTLSHQTNPRPTRTTSKNPVRAVATLYLPQTDELLTIHEDGAVRIFNATPARLGIAIRASPPDPALATCTIVHCINQHNITSPTESAQTRVVLGLRDGHVRIVELPTLATVAQLSPPPLCATPLAVGFSYAPVACLAVAPSVHARTQTFERDTNTATATGPRREAFRNIPLAMYIGYEDGAIAQFDEIGNPFSTPFIAHARKVSAICSFYDGVLLLSIGDDTDPSLAIFESHTTRCLARRMLPYVPTALSRVPPPSPKAPPHDVCPSENAFVVGGEEGQLEIFRIVVLSSKRLEIRLVRRISERVRGKDRAVREISYLRDEAVMMALSSNGELRRWALSVLDASSLALEPNATTSSPHEAPCTYNESNIVQAMSQDFPAEDETRISSVGGVIQAQNVLASILDEASVPEAQKDQLVVEFQKKQADMLGKISQADTELRRARKRISTRFAEGLRPSPASSSFTDQRLIRAARRTAAFEVEFATRRHAETLRDIQASALDKLKILLLNCLKGSRSTESDELRRIRADIERLGSEQVSVQ